MKKIINALFGLLAICFSVVTSIVVVTTLNQELSMQYSIAPWLSRILNSGGIPGVDLFSIFTSALFVYYFWNNIEDKEIYGSIVLMLVLNVFSISFWILSEYGEIETAAAFLIVSWFVDCVVFILIEFVNIFRFFKKTFSGH